MSQTHGHRRMGSVPSVPRTKPKVCSRCELWFAAGPHERVCADCLRPSERAKRAALYRGTKPAISRQTPQVRATRNPCPHADKSHIRSAVIGLCFLPGVSAWDRCLTEVRMLRRWGRLQGGA
jgi:hypothetical protein